MPPWYTAFESWLTSHGWPALMLGSAIIVGVTLFLAATGRGVALAAWLTYLFMP